MKIFFYLFAFICVSLNAQQSLFGDYECSESIKVDKKLKNIYKNLAFEFHLNKIPKVDSNDEDSFIEVKENNPKIFFVSYLVNNSKKDVEIDLICGSLKIIQEAKNKDGEWLPVEEQMYSECGNCFYTLNLKDNYKLMIPIYKYKGDFETQFRLKLNINNEQIIYSQIFMGSISYNRFSKIEARSKY